MRIQFLALIASMATAATSKNTTFCFVQEKNPDFVKNAPAIHYADLIRYNVTLNSTYAATNGSSNGTSLAARGQIGSTTALPLSLESEYVCKVSVGGQDLYLDFDTGSSDLWVFSSLLPPFETTGQHIYNPSLSPSSKLLAGATWDITYADGSGSSGVVYKDTVAVGSAVAIEQAVEAATYVSSDFASNPFSSGLMGLAFSTINTVSPVQQLTFFENILPSLTLPLFTANLKYGSPGSYNFGYIDSTEYKGAITWTPVTKPYGYYAYWQMDLSGFQIGDGAYNKVPINGIADTGTTLLYLPTLVVVEYYSQVEGAYLDVSSAAWVFPCSSQLPDFIFGLGTYRGVVPGDYILFEDIGDNVCYGGIQEDTGIGFAIFGDILLKAQFVVFDHSGPRLGFANKL